MQIDLQQKFFGNSVQQYLVALAAIVIAFLVLQMVKRWLLQLVKNYTGKTSSKYDDVMVVLVEKFAIPYIYLVVNFNIIRHLVLPPRLDRILDVALTIITVIFAARLINHTLHFSLKTYMEKRDEGPARMRQLSGILMVVKVIVWALGILFFLDNVGYDVTTVVAGLGVGGIAIALAAQNILGDLFSYFVIFFDKPFEIGDFIVVGDKMGTVERIGIKTSHVRSLSGEQLVMPNADLVKSTIHNFKRMERRRGIFKVGVAYDTPIELLQQIPGIISEAILASGDTVVDRSHMQGLGEFSINFETVYFINSAEYGVFADVNQATIMRVLQQFRQLGIEIAYPTQKLFVQAEKAEKQGNSGVSQLISSTNDPLLNQANNAESEK
ncbi:mechanosensitive ion channel family protein [Aridibaculum aurantiacum]|uniref:mechanosensitive ion channel family protein n=1 Tax=Aridibaculum aurantiacum TaxID=2810307 RepID=UPI001A96F28A|nr:mechanosensitive ion channel family protein [Aridibaculum aurantiacum]